MALCKLSIALLGTLISLAVGDFRFERFKTFGFADTHKPWFIDEYASTSPYRSEASSLIPHYAGPLSFDNLKHGTDPIPSIISGTKKIPKEDKAFKKAISPFYTLTDADDFKFKEMIMKSGAPYCQEIVAKDMKTDSSSTDKKQMTCYRCKDPKNGSTYEQCSYSSEPQVNSREARSNAGAEKTVDSLTAASSNSKKKSKKSTTDEQLPDAFRFSDDYFHTEASHELPAEYEKNIDNCERVVKDSMVCMVCQDPKTTGKYEQCSYVAQPNEKAYAYTKSSSFGGAKKPKPGQKALKEAIKKTRKAPESHEEEEEPEHEAEAGHRQQYHAEPEELTEHHEPSDHHGDDESHWSGHHHADGDKEGHSSHYVPDHTYHYPSYQDYKGSYGSYEADDEGDEKEASPSQHGCKKVQKDGETCTVCTDPKTGGQSENCAYSHVPKDKVYKYTKSKSFGYPESQKASSNSNSGGEDDDDKAPDASDKQEQRENSSAEDYSGSYASEPSTLDYIKSESEKISKNVKDSGSCRKVKRDSMVCTICKDPKTGGDFEQCNYSYEPDDKVFAYTKSKHFGTPTKTSSDDDYSSGSAEEHPEETYSAPIIYPTGTSVLDYLPKASASELSNVYTTKKPQGSKTESKVDHGFYDATVRRAEIEKIVKDIGAEDRSKCKKVFQGGMTCYRCTDDKGFTNEECVFVTDPEVDATKDTKKTTSVHHQATEAATAIEVTAKPIERTTTTTTTTTTTKQLLEPLTSTSWKSIVTNRKTRETKEEKPKDKDEELEVLDEEREEAEPYDYVAETRPVYDKVLGLTLPAYMLQKSSHELEFDEMVEKAKF